MHRPRLLFLGYEYAGLEEQSRLNCMKYRHMLRFASEFSKFGVIPVSIRFLHGSDTGETIKTCFNMLLLLPHRRWSEFYLACLTRLSSVIHVFHEQHPLDRSWRRPTASHVKRSPAATGKGTVWASRRGRQVTQLGKAASLA